MEESSNSARDHFCAVGQKVAACAMWFETLHSQRSTEALDQLRSACLALRHIGYPRNGDLFAGDRPFEFGGQVTTSVTALMVAYSENIVTRTFELSREGRLNEANLESVLAECQIPDLLRWVYGEWSIAQARLDRWRGTDQPQSKDRLVTPLLQKITVPHLWNRVKDKLDPSGNPVATNRRTVYGWTEEEGFPTEMDWESVRLWVMTKKCIDIGAC